jgi:UDP-glucose 4-epimerase
MRILITGGSGFLGSYIALEALKKKYRVIILDKKILNKIKNKNIKYIKCDLSSSHKLKKIIKKNDIIYHFAGISDIDYAILNPLNTINTNILGTASLLEICKEKKIKKFIFASSIHVHSDIGSFYRITKKSSELLIEEYAKKFGIKFTILRFGSVYGPRQSINNNISNMVYNALKFKKLIYSGDKASERSFVFVKDVAKAAIKIISKKFNNKVILLIGRKKVKVKKVLNIIKNIQGLKGNFIFKNIQKNHYSKNPYSYKEMKESKFFIQKSTQLEIGITKTIDYIKKNKNL